MMKPELPDWIDRRIEKFKRERLSLLARVEFSDIMRRRSFLSGEIEEAAKLVYHRLDEYFTEISESLLDEMRSEFAAKISSEDKAYDVVQHTGFYIYDPEFESEWTRLLNLFTAIFLQNYSTDGRIDWAKLDSPLATI